MGSAAKPVAPYGLTVIESCLGCVLREEGLFCRLSAESSRQLSAIRQTAFYPPGALLFVEGESLRGLFILCSGQAKVSANSSAGRSIILRVVEPGEVLGLSSVIAHSSSPVTAETLAASQVAFIPRAEFLEFLRSHAEISLRVAEHLSMELHKAWEQSRLLALASSTRAKLAQLLLDWAGQQGQTTAEGVRVSLHMTQEEIGETIGTARETVSRLLAEFKRRGVIRIKGRTILIVQPDALRTLTAS
ncbi:MAG: Crp/Fnr family transcriptional regulator [Terriglobia bacterium]